MRNNIWKKKKKKRQCTQWFTPISSIPMHFIDSYFVNIDQMGIDEVEVDKMGKFTMNFNVLLLGTPAGEQFSPAMWSVFEQNGNRTVWCPWMWWNSCQFAFIPKPKSSAPGFRARFSILPQTWEEVDYWLIRYWYIAYKLYNDFHLYSIAMWMCIYSSS